MIERIKNWIKRLTSSYLDSTGMLSEVGERTGHLQSDTIKFHGIRFYDEKGGLLELNSSKIKSI
jgi:hypothetical protein